MDTTKKGDNLENRFYELLLDLIKENQFFAPADRCQVFQKKGYYSRDRKKNIVFDIVVEIYMPHADEYSLLVIIERKNYNHSVPVDDIEEFYAKIQQVASANGKGIVVSSNSFQEGAFSFSSSKGIGLVRLYERDQLEWVLRRSPATLLNSRDADRYTQEAFKALHIEDAGPKFLDFFGYIYGTYTSSPTLVFNALGNSTSNTKLRHYLKSNEATSKKARCHVRYRDAGEIEKVAQSLISGIGYNFGAVPLERICAALQQQHGLQVTLDEELPEGILGTIGFDPPLIRIDPRNDHPGRMRFTLAHEIGHLVLGHSEYMAGERCVESAIELDQTPQLGIEDIMRMEWQANFFASCLLLPAQQLIESLSLLLRRLHLPNRGFGLLYIDDQKCNIDNFFQITTPLMRRYDVSRSVVRHRLERMGYLNDKRSVGP